MTITSTSTSTTGTPVRSTTNLDPARPVSAPGRAWRTAATVALAGALAGCGGGGDDKPAFEARDITAEVEAYYRENPDFFVFSTPEDLPADLEWQDGSGQEEFGSPEARKGGTFRYFVSDFPRTLRFVGPDASGAFRQYIMDSNALGLLSFHPNTLEAIPAIANQWAVGADGKTVYYRIDPGATYSDGEPVTTEDFFFSFYFMRSPHLQAPWYNDYYTKKFERIVRFDDRTLAVTYSEAKPDILYRTALRPVPFHFYRDGFGEDYLQRYQWTMEPTAGPYEVLEKNLKKGKSVTLTKVEDWWAADRPHYRYRYNPDELFFQVIRDTGKAFDVFRKGDVDVHSLTLPEFWYEKLPDDAPEVAAGYIEKVTFYNEIPVPDWGLRLNCSRPPLDNRDIRVGLHYACNWDRVIEIVFRGDFARMNTVSDGYGDRTHPTLKAREFDPVKAEEWFAKAGFTRRGPDGILVNADGQRLSFTITTGYKRLQDVLTVLKEEAKKAGVEFNVEVLEQTAAWKKADEKKHQINFAALNRSVELYPRYWEQFHSYHALEEDGSIKTNTNNETQTADPGIDELIDQYRFSGDLDEMTRLSHELSEKLHEHAAFVPGFKTPFYRVGKWRWVRFPEFFDYRTSRDWFENHLFWIDEEMKADTEAARKERRTFEPSIRVYDQWKVN